MSYRVWARQQQQPVGQPAERFPEVLGLHVRVVLRGPQRHGSRDGHVEEGMKKRSRGSLKGFRSGLAQPGDERACKTCGREVMFVPIVWPVLELLYLQLLRVVSD